MEIVPKPTPNVFAGFFFDGPQMVPTLPTRGEFFFPEFGKMKQRKLANASKLLNFLPSDFSRPFRSTRPPRGNFKKNSSQSASIFSQPNQFRITWAQ